MTRRLLLVCLAAAAVGCGGAHETEPGAGALAEGRKLYQDYGCAACHGSEGRGDGPLARSLPSTPRDLSYPAMYRNGADAASISKTIAEGLMVKGLSMPSYPHIPESERHKIAAYLVNLQKKKR